MVSRLLFVEELPTKQIVQDNGQSRDKDPEKKELRTDLPQNISGKIRVVPYVPSKSNVYNASCKEFGNCCNDGGRKNLKKEARFPFPYFVQKTDNDK